MKDIPKLNYTSPREELAERFHMSEESQTSSDKLEEHEMAGRSSQKTKSALSGQKPVKLRTKALLRQRALLAEALKKSLGQP